MNSKIFELEINQGKLTIPSEIEDYLSHCQGKVKISLTVESVSEIENDLSNAWNQWFQEVEEIKPTLVNDEENNYKKLLIDKYKQQGLEL